MQTRMHRNEGIKAESEDRRVGHLVTTLHYGVLDGAFDFPDFSCTVYKCMGTGT